MPRDSGRPKRRRASSGPSRISPPNKKEKKTRKSPVKRKLLKEHVSEFDLLDLEKDKQVISDIVASDLSVVSESENYPESENMGENSNDTRGPADFDGFSEEDILPTDMSDNAKVLHLLKGLWKDLREVKASNKQILVKQDKLHGELEQIKEDNKKLRKDVKALQAGQQKHSADIKKVQADVASHSTQFEAINSKLDRHEEVISKIDMGDTTEFPYHRTVVAQHLWYNEGENVERKAQLLIHRHLNQPGIEIKRVKRLGVKDDYDGIVKIELGSEAEVETVLQSKSILGQHRDESVRGIFIRQSQPENERRNVRNMNTLIREVDPEGNSGLYVNYKGDVVRRRGYGYRRGNGSGPRGRSVLLYVGGPRASKYPPVSCVYIYRAGCLLAAIGSGLLAQCLVKSLIQKLD